MTKQLFITADDFGVHDSIDQGIEKCIDVNAIDCVAIIVTHSSSESRIQALLQKYSNRIQAGTLALGLHLSLNCGSPQFRNNPFYLKEIEKNGVFKYTSGAKIYMNIAKLAEEHTTSLRKEMEMQYKKFVSIVGTKPAHMSSHTGIYQSKELYKIYSTFCLEHNLHMRNPTLLFYSGIPEWQIAPKQYMASMVSRTFGRAVKPKVVKWQETEVRDALRKDKSNGLITSDHFIEHFFRNGDQTTLDQIFANISTEEYAQNEKSFEMVVHPMWYEDNLSRRDFKKFKDTLPIGINRKHLDKRKLELRTLINEDIKQKMANSPVPISLYEIKKPEIITNPDNLFV